MEKNARHQQLADFLRRRRAHLLPAEVGLPTGQRRRALGLRREEVAQLAGISVDWYTWLEQGRNIRVSEQALTSLARALKMNVTETDHPLMLAQNRSPVLHADTVSETLQHLLTLQGIMPAFIMGRRWDILAWNQAACGLFGDFATMPMEDRNVLWLMFGNAATREILLDWDSHAHRLVGQFRLSYDTFADDPKFDELIERLLHISAEFCEWWPRHCVQARTANHKVFNHPQVGTLTFEQTTLQIHDNVGLRMVVEVPISGTPTIERLQQLATMSG